MEGLRGRPRAQSRGFARPGPTRSVSGTAVTAGLHSQAGRRQRPLAVAALEDKIVQRAVVALLNAIYEEDFLGFSYGFRPGRGPHDALDALCVGIGSRKVSFILDADIRSFFDEISQEWLIRFLEHRIGDRRIIRLIQKWLKAGVLEDGVVSVSDRGTGQGSVISPLLANIYLHYALDLWAERWRRRKATGDMIIVRYADDFIVGFQHESDARRFLDEMRERLRGVRAVAASREDPVDRVRTLRGGTSKAARARQAGDLQLPGLHLHLAARPARQIPASAEEPAGPHGGEARMIKDELRQRMHQPIPEQGRWLRQVVRGYFNYHAVPTNCACTRRVPAPCHRPLAAHAAASQPKGSDHVGADDADWRTPGFPNRSSSILGQASASPSHIQGGSRMRESRTYGSVRGARHETRVPTATHQSLWSLAPRISPQSAPGG